MASIATVESLKTSLQTTIPASSGHAWIDSEGRLVVGTYPLANAYFDFAGESFVSLQSVEAKPKRRVSFLNDAPRVTEKYEIETSDAIYLVGSNKQLLVEGLNIIEEIRPGTHEELSKQKKRTKRPVAESHEELYDVDHPTTHSEKLKSGYFVATNNKGSESRNIVREAVQISGLVWGKDIVFRPVPK